MTEKTKKELILEEVEKTNQTISSLELYINSLKPADLTISQADYDMWVKRLQPMKDSIPWLESQVEAEE